MNDQKTYIQPNSDEYTGYSTYIISGTNTSDLESFFISAEDITQRYIWAVEDQPEEDLAERFNFYETKI